jgi:hypothetical protein
VKRFGLIVVLLLAACSGGDDDAASPSDGAMAYALDKSGGVTTGCSAAAPGAEAEAAPGCIFAVAFAGCSEGLTGERLGPVPVEDEFPDEPGLVDLYHQAVEDCSV